MIRLKSDLEKNKAGRARLKHLQNKQASAADPDTIAKKKAAADSQQSEALKSEISVAGNEIGALEDQKKGVDIEKSQLEEKALEHLTNATKLFELESVLPLSSASIKQKQKKALAASLVSAYGVKGKDKKRIEELVEKQGGLFGKSKSAAMGVLVSAINRDMDAAQRKCVSRVLNVGLNALSGPAILCENEISASVNVVFVENNAYGNSIKTKLEE